MAVVAIISSVLAALMMPSMVGMMRKNSLQSSANQVIGALREAQRSAMRNGQTCTVNISSTGVSSTNTSTNTCITSPVTLGSGTQLSLPSGSTFSLPLSLAFSYKGNPSSTGMSSSTELILIIESPNSTVQRRCVAISAGIGIMRPGTYSGTTCTASL